MTTAIQEYSQTEAALATLQENYGGVIWDVTKPAEMTQAKVARKEIRSYRVALEDKRQELKKDVLERGRLIDGEAKRIREALEAIENPIDAQIKAEEQRKEREAQAEALRVNQINQAISDMNLIVPSMAGKSSAVIAKQISDLNAYQTAEWAMEFTTKAEAVKKTVLLALQQLHDSTKAQEEAAAAEAARIAAERAELARLRAEQEERAKTEQARIAEETRARAEAEAASRRAIEEAERASREKIEAAEREARKAREAEEAALKAERDRLEAERRAIEEAQRKEREAAEAKARAEREAKEAEERKQREAEDARKREIERKKAEKLDAHAMLALFKTRYGHLEEFSGVVAAIDGLQQKKAA